MSLGIKSCATDWCAQGCFSLDEKAPDFWKSLTSDYVAQGCFPQKKKGPRFLEAQRLTTLLKVSFFLEQTKISGSPPDLRGTDPGALMAGKPTEARDEGHNRVY